MWAVEGAGPYVMGSGFSSGAASLTSHRPNGAGKFTNFHRRKIAGPATVHLCHCEERSDVAIPWIMVRAENRRDCHGLTASQ